MSTIEIPKYTILTKRKDAEDSPVSSLQSPVQESAEIDNTDTIDVSSSIAMSRPRRNIKKPDRYEPNEVCLDDKDPEGDYDDTDTEDTVSSGVEWESEDEITEDDEYDEDDSFIAGSDEEEYESELEEESEEEEEYESE
jgi:hypothetical protein